MKALFLTNEYPPNVYGGAGVHVEFLTRELARLMDVEVRFFGEAQEVAPHLVARGFSQEAPSGASGESFAPVFTALARNLAMAAMPVDADVVHCHTWYSHFAGIAIQRVYGTPLVITTHSLEPLRPWKREQLAGGYELSSWIEQSALTAADAVVAVSAGTRADILRLFPLDPERVRVIHNGIDPSLYRPTCEVTALEAYGVDPRRPYVLFVGRITRQKGIVHLVRALPLIRDDVQIVLCAGAADTPEIAAEMEEGVAAAQARRPHIVWIREVVPRQQLIGLYSHATVFCCPSVYEPFGIINLEAMACGTAVVASAVGGIPEVVVDGITGVLVHLDPQEPRTFEPLDAGRFTRDLAVAVNKLLDNPVRAAEMGRAGRQRVEDVFSWSAIARKTAGLYRELIAATK